MTRWNPWRYLRDRHPEITVLCSYQLTCPSLGVWDGHQLVHLDARMQQAQRRCTLTHELVHIARGPCDPHDAREEAIVAEIAARLLITLDQLIDAILWGQGWPDPRELWVDQATLDTRLATLTRVERAIIDHRLEGRAA